MTRILILFSCVTVMLGATVWFASVGGAVTCDLEIAELQPLTPVGQPQDAPSLAVSVERSSRSCEDGAPREADRFKLPVRGRVDADNRSADAGIGHG